MLQRHKPTAGNAVRQAMWDAIRAWAGTGDGTFKADGVSRAAKVEMRPVQKYLAALVKLGYVTIVQAGAGPGDPHVYRLEKDCAIDPLRIGRGPAQHLRARAWWIFRKNGRASLDGLLATLTTGEQKAPRSNLAEYLRMLGRVKVLEAAGGSVWRLRLDLGREAPIARQDGSVFDPNGGRTLLPGADHE